MKRRQPSTDLILRWPPAEMVLGQSKVIEIGNRQPCRATGEVGSGQRRASGQSFRRAHPARQRGPHNAIQNNSACAGPVAGRLL
jgi:hypothetical protein